MAAAGTTTEIDSIIAANDRTASAPAGTTRPLYGQSLALLTDLYQLTMAYGYWKLGTADKEAVFHLSFRKNPFAGGYSVADVVTSGMVRTPLFDL